MTYQVKWAEKSRIGSGILARLVEWILFFFPQTGLLSQSYRHQSEGRGEGFLNKAVAELLSLKDQARYTLLISIPLLTKQITAPSPIDGIEFTEAMHTMQERYRTTWTRDSYVIFILSPMMNNDYKNIICGNVVYGS